MFRLPHWFHCFTAHKYLRVVLEVLNMIFKYLTSNFNFVIKFQTKLFFYFFPHLLTCVSCTQRVMSAPTAMFAFLTRRLFWADEKTNWEFDIARSRQFIMRSAFFLIFSWSVTQAFNWRVVIQFRCLRGVVKNKDNAGTCDSTRSTERRNI